MIPMGWYFSTPRVLGVGYSRRLSGGSSRQSGGCLPALGVLLVLGLIVQLIQTLGVLIWTFWYIVLPMALVLGLTWWLTAATRSPRQGT